MSEEATNTTETPPEEAPVYPKWERDEDGLLKHVSYVRNPDGSINWRKMISPEFLAPNKKLFVSKGKPVPATIEGLDDSELVIKLGGIKRLAQLRGYSDLSRVPIAAAPNYVAARAIITWIPNFETCGVQVKSDGWADAHPNNTEGFTKYYLAAMAENRSFIRAVRSFLGIEIVGQDEVGDAPEEAASGSAGSPIEFLENLLKKNKIGFENFQSRMIKENVEGAESWQNLKDVPAVQVFELAELVQTILNAKKEAAKEEAAKKS